MSGDSAKTLLKQYNKEKYKNFILNEDTELLLPVISSVPWIGLSPRRDVYKKTILPQGKENHLRFITKNGESHAFIWRTNPEKLKTAVRWGIIKTEAITAKVISALGKYRIVAHERVAKGMMSNTQALKLELLDLYQEHFEALQGLELHVNKNNTVQDYEMAIDGYIKKLQSISRQLESRFSTTALTSLNCKAIEQIHCDLKEDIQRAGVYLTSIRKEQNLSAVNRARGSKSILEFIKTQMTHNLYALQGINQDLSYSNKRKFALTRGEFNDCIEDARKEIDDYQADLRNAITPIHQGSYGTEGETSLSYDFSQDKPNPQREREVLLAISFIEGWDVVKNNHSATPYVSNTSGEEPLTLISATSWQTHRNFKAFFQSTAYFLLNTLKSFFVSTYPWEEEAWSHNAQEFHLVTKSLRQYAKPNEPLWYKPYRFIRSSIYSIVDMIKGIRDIGAEFIFNLPEEIFKDYYSTQKLLPMTDMMKQAEQEINNIKEIERQRLDSLLRSYHTEHAPSEPTSKLAQTEYPLSSGEWDDIINSIVHGINGFSSLFTHGIYAKDPVAGLIFTAGYGVGGAAIFFPSTINTLLGSAYVNWATSFSHSMGSSQLAAAVAGGSTQAQLLSSTWDLAMHGPGSSMATMVNQVLEDPLTLGTYFAAAYGLGYVMANGIHGYTIPWVSEFLKEDLGSTPEASYPLLGGKIAILLHEAFQTHKIHPYHCVKVKYNGKELDLFCFSAEYQKIRTIIDRCELASWLSNNSSTLPKLRLSTLYTIERQIDFLFSAKEASSLKKILYPQKPRSIAHRFFSIPLSYIPAFLRLMIAPFISLIACFKGEPYPFKPIIMASSDLSNRVVKDLSRLMVAAIGVIHLVYNLMASQIKALAYTVNMLVNRLAGIFGWHPGHAMHKLFSNVHVFFDRLGEIFYPARLIKHVNVAHPAHTIRETEHSYHQLMRKFKSIEVSQKVDESIHSSSPLPHPCDAGVSVNDDYDDFKSIRPEYEENRGAFQIK
ncbi:hypothetical protein [Legionella fairfieldensis]|uniref:hypothetical protein n=1 Tax=Legionella fairfieldensis TaxID=45064 RepID=UPI000490B399|nr:hypothetical protein [Legionella fairfieldensis]